MKRVGVIGATGFVGKYLCMALHARGDEVVAYSRAGRGDVPNVHEWRKNPARGEDWDFCGLDAIINLAGERVNQRWTEKNRALFYDSRVTLSASIAASLRGMTGKPRVWVNASAVGYYGDTGDKVVDESGALAGGYLAELCAQWEAAAADVDGVRIAHGRIGMVLGNGGMAWDQVKMLFSLGLGARLGHGRQWMAWIHVDDVVGGLLHAMDHAEICGAFNLVAPEPERNADFTKLLGKMLRRPAFAFAPTFALRLILGDFSSAVLASQRLVPKVLLDHGYTFRFGKLAGAFENLIGGR